MAAIQYYSLLFDIGYSRGKATSALECHCPVEFSFNPNKTHLNKLIKVRQVSFFSGLKLNSAGHPHSRTDAAHPWATVSDIVSSTERNMASL